MADITHGGPRHRRSEFILYNGVRLFGTCGPNSAASALWAARNSQVLTADVYALMRQYGWCDLSGASTLVGLNAAIKQMGGTVLDWVDWQASWPGWLAWFKQYAGKAAIIFETNNGQALVDSISGLGENAVNLVHHFVCVHIYHPGGWSDLFNANLPEGFGVADGDNLAGGNYASNNFNAADVLQFYPLAVLAACQPAGAIAVSVPGAILGGPMAWVKQGDGSGRDAQGHTCGAGDMNYIAAAPGLASADGLLSETFYSANDSFLPLNDGRIITAHHNPTSGAWSMDEQGAQALVTIWSELQAALARPTSNPAEHAKAAALDGLMSLYGIK